MDKEARKDVEKLVHDFFKHSEDITPVRYGGSLHEEEELVEMICAILDGWWIGGKRTEEFESKFREYMGVNHAIFCNSGSSALMLAFDSTGLEKGSEIISPALTFPTTINPAIRQGMNITLVDSDIGTYNVNVDEIEKAITPKTKALVIPHLLGNMSDLSRITDLVEDHKLIFLEDCCEAIGSRYNGRLLGTFGNTAAFSFFPSHHISAAGGGMFTTNSRETYLRALSLKYWGRQYSDIKYIPNQTTIRSDYIQQYTYETIGYNFNVGEVEAAKGIVQMGKLDEFNKLREKNFDILMKFFKKYSDLFMLPEIVKNAQPSWFAFPLTIRDTKINREELMDFLFKKKIESRYILCGNIAKQPAYSDIKFRTVSDLTTANKVFTDSFFIGVYPGITKEKMNYMHESFEEFLDR
ncbi:aminotransferase class V-fold PLP-dependent enzyme [Candidatus Woesearchaeota archaeon]|nr:aminotransferase class V-fold PLP-dependent enzyme [Candidatus Woesearchaeota archaeon]